MVAINELHADASVAACRKSGVRKRVERKCQASLSHAKSLARASLSVPALLRWSLLLVGGPILVSRRPVLRRPALRRPLRGRSSRGRPVRLRRSVLWWPILRRSVLWWPILRWPILRWPVLRWPVLRWPVLWRPVLRWPVLWRTGAWSPRSYRLDGRPPSVRWDGCPADYTRAVFPDECKPEGERVWACR